jgi:hypothetical protein
VTGLTSGARVGLAGIFIDATRFREKDDRRGCNQQHPASTFDHHIILT